MQRLDLLAALVLVGGFGLWVLSWILFYRFSCCSGDYLHEPDCPVVKRLEVEEALRSDTGEK
jgi:hypothetical protein